MTTTRGRPRSADIDHAVRSAVREVLSGEGYAATSIERVARVASVPKSAIYRRWDSRAEMVFDVVVHSQEIAPPAATGTLVGDLAALVEHVIALFCQPDAVRSLPGLLAEMNADAERVARFREHWIEPERAVVAAILRRADERGETVTIGVEDLHAQLLGLVFAWVHLLGDPPSDLAARVTRSLVVLATSKEH